MFSVRILLITQFLSALADNALLFAAIALLKSQQAPDWNIPLLQEFFIAAYILTAPFVGAFADAIPKNRVLLMGTGLKLIGALGFVAGLNPFACYALVGLGAAVYSPAKYGILSELVGEERLVKANAWLESSTILAILMGVLVGGKLSDVFLQGLIIGLAAVYALALIGTLFIERTPAPRPLQKVSFWQASMGEFVPAVQTLWRDPEARLSLIGTSLFWSAGAVLRFLLIAWIPFVLLIEGNATVGYFNAATAVGIVAGAMLAGRLIGLADVRKALPAGVGIGLLVLVFSLQANFSLSLILLAAIGLLGGFFVVPLNALLQSRGHATVGPGRAIAVQNFFENLGMLALMGVYLLLEKGDVTPIANGAVIGGVLLLSMSLLYRIRLAQSQR